ncbi:alpha/beta hydrolase [bacterium]|nr:alpha/beta hydrolase [bacterium]
MRLLFIHGSGGSAESWHYQTNHFKKSIAVDLPGHPHGELLDTIDGCVDWLHDYVLKKDLRDLVLVGHSLGGGIALLYTLKYPERVKGIVTVGSGARLRVHPMTLEMLEKEVENPEHFGEFATQSLALIEKDVADVMARRTIENGPAVMLNDLRACDRFDIMDRLEEIQVPLLALCGDQDIMTPPKYSSFMVSSINGAKAEIIQGGTHMVFAEKPEEVNKAIEDFINEIE